MLEGTGRLRVGDETLTVPRHGGVLVGPDPLRQVFNDTDAEVLWLIIGAPEGKRNFCPAQGKEARHVAYLSRRADAIAQGTHRRGMAAQKFGCGQRLTGLWLKAASPG